MDRIIKIIFSFLMFNNSLVGQNPAEFDPAIKGDEKFPDSEQLSINSFSNETFYNTSLTDQQLVRFRFYNDFQEYLQVDKFIHSFNTYALSSIGYNCLKAAGFNKTKALIWGGAGSFVLMSSKDVYDGFYLKGFSWSDMIANVLGISFFASQEVFFDEQVVKYKYSFSKSPYSKTANGYLGRTIIQNYLKDFNSHSFWLSVNINKIIPKSEIPDWMNIAFGYSANGMIGACENIIEYNDVLIPETQRYRQFLLSLDVDFSKIHTQSRFLKILFGGLNFVKIPFPTLEVNSKGNFKAYWLYF